MHLFFGSWLMAEKKSERGFPPQKAFGVLRKDFLLIDFQDCDAGEDCWMFGFDDRIYRIFSSSGALHLGMGKFSGIGMRF